MDSRNGAGWEMGYWESNHHFIIPTTTQQNVELYAHTSCFFLE